MSSLLDNQRDSLDPAVVAVADRMSDSGHKVTRPRLAVIEAAVNAPGAFSVADLEHWLDQRAESPGIASIFRTVRLLTDLGLFQRIHGAEECHRYIVSQGHRHYIVCNNCGALASFDECELRELAERLERSTGFHIESHLLEFFGRCPRCIE
jgi:Fur family ferric uptake transcriptional regulator